MKTRLLSAIAALTALISNTYADPACTIYPTPQNVSLLEQSTPVRKLIVEHRTPQSKGHL